MGIASCGARLQRLGAPDLASVHRHCGIIRHVLRFKRCNSDAPIAQRATETCNQEGFTHIGPRPLKHQGRHLEFHAKLGFDTIFEGMFDQTHFGDKICRLDQFRFGFSPCQADMGHRRFLGQEKTDNFVDIQIIIP